MTFLSADRKSVLSVVVAAKEVPGYVLVFKSF